MHILIVTDQHPDSLGGAQVAIRTQRASLERLGHRVTIAAPALRRPGYTRAAEDQQAYIELPSLPITKDREYGLSWPARRTDRVFAAALRGLPPVDLVHVQGDFWGAMIGVRAARGLSAARGRTVPLVFTLHNNVDQGTRAVTPLAPLVFGALRCWRTLALGQPRRTADSATSRAASRASMTGAEKRTRVHTNARGAWRYLAELVAEAAAVIAPSRHFAAQLESRGVFTPVDVVRGGVDDELIDRAARLPRAERERPRLVWLGRMSHEKRILEFVDAIALSNIDVDVRLYGAGMLLEQVRDRVRRAGLTDRVTIEGPVPHDDALAALRDADALVQTSVGFETQGLTPFEAALLGTPTVFCDPAIAEDAALDPSWVTADASVAALAATLREAVGELATGLAHEKPLRVPDDQASGFLQSEQTRELVALYERVLSA